MSYECPLCSTDFETATCRSSCPMASGCAMVRCPRCGYEFVESGRIADLLRRWIRRGPKQTCAQPPAAGDGVIRLIDLPLGASGSVVFIAPSAGSRVARLAAYGIVAGTELRLMATVTVTRVSASEQADGGMSRDVSLQITALALEGSGPQKGHAEILFGGGQE